MKLRKTSLLYIICFSLVRIIFCGTDFISSNEKEVDIKLKVARDAWSKFAAAARAHMPNRREYVLQRLSYVPRVYKDSTKSILLGLENTIIITSHLWNMDNSPKKTITSLACNLDRFSLSALFYLPVGSSAENLFYSKPNIPGESTIFTIDFPDEKYWTFLLHKTNAMKNSSRAPYSANLNMPNHAEYGSLSKLIAILEIIELGINVIYLDDDVMLVRDPIPFLIRGNVDIVASMEARVCDNIHTPIRLQYGGTVEKFKRVEPNTGVAYYRSRDEVIYLILSWIHVMIKKQIYNDQKAFPFWLISYFTDACLIRRRAGNSESSRQGRNHSSFHGLSACYLPNTLFPNGVMMQRCFNKYHAYAISQDILSLRNLLLPGNEIPIDFSFRGLNASAIRAFDEKHNIFLLTPITYHLNYNKGPKESVLKSLQLWPLNENNKTCVEFDMKALKSFQISSYLELEHAYTNMMRNLDNLIPDSYYTIFDDNYGIPDIPLLLFDGNQFTAIPFLQFNKKDNGDYNFLLQTRNWVSATVLSTTDKNKNWNELISVRNITSFYIERKN